MDHVLIYFYSVKDGPMYEYNLLNDTVRGFRNERSFYLRRAYLDQAGIPYKIRDDIEWSNLGSLNITYLPEVMSDILAAQLTNEDPGNPTARKVWGRGGLFGPGYYPVDSLNGVVEETRGLRGALDKLKSKFGITD
jgi:hypothetical protein